MSTKIPASTLNIKQFLLRQEVLKLYREIFRTIRIIPDSNNQDELIDWTRTDFRNNLHHTDETTIKMLLHHGRRSLKELQTNLDLSGNTARQSAIRNIKATGNQCSSSSSFDDDK